MKLFIKHLSPVINIAFIITRGRRKGASFARNARVVEFYKNIASFINVSYSR
jgi:hypothetical protein